MKRICRVRPFGALVSPSSRMSMKKVDVSVRAVADQWSRLYAIEALNAERF